MSSLLWENLFSDGGSSERGTQDLTTAHHKRPLAAHDVLAHDALKVYFDAGIHQARHGFAPRAHLGFAIFAEHAKPGSDPLIVGLTGSHLGGAVGYWHPDGEALLARVEATIRSYPATRGSQLYDLVAAHGALAQLRGSEYRGKVRMLGDGQEVVAFLEGRDGALHLAVAGLDIAKTIRDRIRQLGADLGELTWTLIRTDENWADPILKRMDAELGDR